MKPTIALMVAGTVTTLQIAAIGVGLFAAANAINWTYLWLAYPREVQ
jgi:hypothetical protein